MIYDDGCLFLVNAVEVDTGKRLKEEERGGGMVKN